MVEKYVSKLADFSASDFEAVFNCTGLGAKQLCSDNQIVPIRGQVVKGELYVKNCTTVMVMCTYLIRFSFYFNIFSACTVA